ncbi:MAG: transposase [Synergistaceae bacterium]|nr:transposase [Synergistaceae bacterium]
MLRYKLYFHGKKLIEINQWYTSSQMCNVFGHKNKAVKDLRIRKWDCPLCGTYHDRDINAAINLREESKKLAASTLGTTGNNTYGEGVLRAIAKTTSVRKSG